MSSNPLGRGLESLIPKNQQKNDTAAPAPVIIPDDNAAVFQSAEEAAKVFISPTEQQFGQANSPQNAPVIIQDLEPVAQMDEFVAEKKPEITTKVFVPEKKIEEKKEKLPKEADEAIYYVEVSKVRPNPDQPRKNFNEESIRELASSIREFGLLQPIVVSKIEHDTDAGTEVEYELIAGERRLMACKFLGLDTIPAIIRNVRLERERLELAIIENLQRENLNPMEMGRAYARLQDEFRLTQREVAARLGKSRETVANTLRLLELPSEIQEAIEKGQITESHGRLLLTIDDPALQSKLFRDLLSNKLTTRELKDYSSNYAKSKDGTSPSKQLTPEIKMAEGRLASELGAPVSIKDRGGAGKITISFYSREELLGILKRLGAQEDDSLSP